MIALNWLEVWLSLALVAAIGGGGYWVGFLTGYDLGQRDEAAERDGQAPELGRLPAYDPADPWRLGRRQVPPWAELEPWPADEAEPDTAPLRRILAPVRAAVAAALGPGPNGDARRFRPVPAEALELVMQHDAEAAELEIRALAAQAEASIGRVIERVRDDLGRATGGRTT